MSLGIPCLLASFIASSAMAAGTWELTTPLPVPKTLDFAVNWNGAIYIVGGFPWRNGGDQDGSVFKLENGVWSEVEPLNGIGPTIGQNGAVDDLNRIVVWGGHTAPDGDPGSTRAYLPDSGVIANIQDSNPFGTDYTSAAVDGQGRVYRMCSGNGPGGLNYPFAARYTASTNTWESIPSLPYARASVATAYDGQGHIWGFGGYSFSGTIRLLDTIRYDVASNTWSNVGMAFLPVRTSNARAVLGADGKVYLIGGLVGTPPYGDSTDAVWVLDPVTQTLTAGPPLNLARHDFAAALGNDKFIYVIAGSSTVGNANQSVERLYTGVCPSVTSQSNATALSGGATLTLNATPAGDAPLTYQWKKDGTALANGPTGSGSTVSGATATTLTVTNVGANDAGSYTFSVTNPCSTVTGNGIQVTVNVAIPGDYNGDGHVNGSDLAQLLGAWGTANAVIDLTGDGLVDAADLGVLLGAWG